MNGLPSGDYVFKYIDRDDIERVRQKILQRRKLQLFNNVRACGLHIRRETVNCSVKCELFDKSPTREEREHDVEDDVSKSLDSDRNVTEPHMPGTFTQSPQSPVKNGNRLKSPKKIVRRSNLPGAKGTKIVVKSSAESIESNDNMLIRLTSYQQSIDAKLDEIIPALTKIKNCDGSLEVEKYEKKFADHLKVFSRNYLYQIECIISEIQQPLTYNDFTAKVFSLYEMIYLGLNAFVRNLSHFVGIKVPDKLQKLLSCIRDATKLCVKFDFFDQEDSIVVSLVSKVDRILNKIQFFDSKIEEIRKKKWNRREFEPKISIAGRLSMYGSEKMTRRKFNRPRKSKAHRDSESSQSSGHDEVLVEKTLVPI